MTDTPTPPQNTTTPKSRPELVRPRQGRMLAGVAAGVADRFDVDVALVRLGFAVLALAGGGGVALYLLGWLALRSDDQDRSIAERWFGNERTVRKEAAS